MGHLICKVTNLYILTAAHQRKSTHEWYNYEDCRKPKYCAQVLLFSFLFLSVEKEFFISSSPSRRQNISISNTPGYCGSFPNWYFVAPVIPSKLFPQPIFVYSKYNSIILRKTRDDKLYGALLNYFYASETNHSSSKAMYFSQNVHDLYTYVTEFGSKPTSNAFSNILFVYEFDSVKGKSELFFFLHILLIVYM